VTAADRDLFAAQFAFGMALAAATVYAKWRGPIGFSAPLLFLFLGVAGLLLFVPILTRPFRWSASSYALRVLATLLVILGLGWLADSFPAVRELRWGLAALGALAWTIVVARAVLRSWRMGLLSFVFLGIGLAFGVWTTLKCYANYGYLSPLTMEFLSRGVLPNPDTLFLADLANMIRFYGVTSSGLQGVPALPYHSAGLAVFAWLSSLLDLDVITAFIIGMPLLFIPLCYGAMLRVAFRLQGLFGDARVFSSLAATLAIVGCTIGFVSAASDVALAVWHSDLNSQTYSFSLFMLFSAIEILLGWVMPRLASDQHPAAWQSVAIAAGAFILAAGTTMSKGTVGVLYAAGVCFIAWRSGTWKNRVVLTVVFGTVAGIAAAFGVLWDSAPTAISLAHFFLSQVKTDWVTYLLMGFLWPILACVALVNLAGRRPGQATAIGLLAETLLILVILSMMPGLVMLLPSGAADYFSNVSVMVGLVALAAVAPLTVEQLPSGRDWLRPLPARLALVFFVCWGLGAGAYINALVYYRDSVKRRNSELTLLPMPAQPHPMMTLLAELRGMPVPDRRWTLVDIPASRADYWGLAACRDAPFLMPAVAGFAFLDGRPDVSCNAQNYGYSTYSVREIATEGADVPPCDRRRDTRFRYIVSLVPVSSQWVVTDCAAPKN